MFELPGSIKVDAQHFKNIYLEDYLNIRKEADDILRSARSFQKAGEFIKYNQKIKQYKAYEHTAETMLLMAVKFPMAQA